VKAIGNSGTPRVVVVDVDEVVVVGVVVVVLEVVVVDVDEVVVVGVVVVVLEVVVVATAHAETAIVLVSIVTAPFRANAAPVMVAPVFRVMLVSARIVPWKAVVVPRVAELPTCQKTLHARAPPVRTTLLPDPVMRVLPAWKIKTESGLP